MAWLLGPFPNLSCCAPAIPEVDIGPLIQPSSEQSRLRAIQELAQAVKDVGFVTITNHGISKEMLNTIDARAREFFALPLESRMRLARRRDNPKNSNTYCGYFPASTNGKHGLDIGPSTSESESYFEQHDRRLPLEELQPWPSEEPSDFEVKRSSHVSHGWKLDVLEYYKRMQDLGNHLMRAFAEAFNLPSEQLIDQLQSKVQTDSAPPLSTLRFNYYPNITLEDAKQLNLYHGETPLSCDTHTDAILFTILNQADVGGLQVEAKVDTADDSRTVWVDVPVVPGSFVINTGVAMQRLTNDLWNATNHRVVFKHGQERLSIPFFFSGAYDGVLDPLKPCVASSGLPPKYPKTLYGPYLEKMVKMHKEYRSQDDAFVESSPSVIQCSAEVNISSSEDSARDCLADLFDPKLVDRRHEKIVSFIHQTEFESIPAEVVEELKRSLLDILGTAIGAQKTRAAQLIRDFVAENFIAFNPLASLAHIWMDGRPVSPMGATLANSMTVDALDIHDSGHAAKGHAGAAVVPAAISLSGAFAASKDRETEWVAPNAGPPTSEPMSGKELLIALAIGYEVAYRAGVTLVNSIRENGIYMSSGAWNTVGVAAVASRRMKLNTSATIHALSIAESHSPRSDVMRVMDNPSMVKDGSGMGGMNGIMAAKLAKKGFTAPPPKTTDSKTAEVSTWNTLGTEWHILRYHVYKKHSTCYWAQAAVSAALYLRSMLRLQFGADTPKPEPHTAVRLPIGERRAQIPVFLNSLISVQIRTFPEALHLFQGIPSTTEEAQYSLNFAVACALVNGQVGPNEVDVSFARPVSETIAQVMNRTAASLHPDFLDRVDHDSKTHDNIAEVLVSYSMIPHVASDCIGNVTEVSEGYTVCTVTSGMRFVEWDHFKGQDRPTTTDIRQKFRWLGRSVGANHDDMHRLEDLVMSMETLEDASSIDRAMARLKFQTV